MADLADAEMSWPVVDSTDVYRGYVIGVRRDTLRGSDGSTFDRDVITHRGSVAVVAIDDAERLLVVTQYRHPPRRRMVELPAGLVDVADEDPRDAAARELAEEGHVRAERWSTLLELALSPGVSDEVIAIYLAEGISTAAVPTGFLAEHEESTMTREWVPLAEVVAAALAGRVTNAALVAGALAAWLRRHPGDIMSIGS
ncbi:MAG: NUDIX domain-containing protein [Nocardioidaceae bacterium]